MGLQSALSTALTGLTAAETTIDVVGNNVANSNTVGFKESEAIFATQFLQTQSLGSGPTGNNGGTNPRQIGLGTQVAEISPDFTQGTIEISANPLDMAIQGDGFFIVQGSQGEEFYTRNGQFSTNANNELVTINGQRVLGFGVDDQFNIQATGLVPITIPIGSETVAQSTNNVFLEGALTPTGIIGDTPGVVESVVLSNGSVEVPPNLSASDVNAVNLPNVSSTTVAADATPGAITGGTYSYRVTFVDGNGQESPASLDVGPIVTTDAVGANDDSILLSNLPAADGINFTSINIYRTDGSGTGDYYLVGNTTNATFTDSLADATITAPTNDVLNTDGLAAGNYSYYVTFHDPGSGTESRPTSLIGPLSISADGRRVLLNNLPSPTTSDFSEIRIYRNTSTDPSSYYLVDTLPSGTTSYIDSSPDVDIVDPDNQINLDGPAVDFSTLLTDVVTLDGSTYVNLFEEGTLSFTPRRGGRALATQELEITATSTVQDLMNFMNETLGIQEPPGPDPDNPIPAGAGAFIADGRLQFVSNLGVDNEIGIGLSAFTLTPTGGVSSPVNFPFTLTQSANGESAVTDFVVYDSLGVPISVRLTAVLESTSSSSTTYRWYAESSDNDPITGSDIAIGTGTIEFDSEGNITEGTRVQTVSVERRNVASASPLEFNLDFSAISGLAQESSSINASRQDGSAAGTLSSFIVSESGRIVGVFSNGISRDLGQIRLARFANPTGLTQLGENLFAEGVNSGLSIEGNPGEQGIGSITAGAVELSNTDVGQNLIELILASTQYRSGARVITAVQELLDELLALRR